MAQAARDAKLPTGTLTAGPIALTATVLADGCLLIYADFRTSRGGSRRLAWRTWSSLEAGTQNMEKLTVWKAEQVLGLGD